MGTEFEGFLRDLLAKTAASLEGAPAAAAAAADTAGDALRAPRAEREAATRGRQASERACAVAMEGVLFKERPDVEKRWREEVRHRKKKERKQREYEAARAAEEELQVAQLRGEPPDSASGDRSLTAAAREMWAEQARTRERAQAEAADGRRLAEQQLLEAEWEPTLARHREAARARRQEAARHEQAAREQELASMQREAEAMGCEDRASAAFAAEAEAQCRRIASSPVDPAAKTAAEALLLQRMADQRRLREMEEVRLQAEASRRRKEEEHKEREYREWKEQVRATRCQRQRLQETHAPERRVEDAARRHRAESEGRDFLQERALESQSVLQATVRTAEVTAKSIKDRGGSPRRLLEKARALAEEQRKVRDAKEPARLEQELWDSLLAKNRLARQQERGVKTPRTPRWGL